MLSIEEINLLQAQNEGYRKQNESLQKEKAELKAYKDVNEDFKTAWEELKAENERLKKENEILLGQLVINDGEDVTVQISESQFDKYNKYHQTLQEIKAIANTRFVNGLNEEADIYNADMDRILDLITKAEEE